MARTLFLKLAWRLVFLGGYLTGIWGAAHYFNQWWPGTRLAFLWSFANAETAYFWWLGFGLDPFTGYLPLILAAGTTNIFVVWLVFFSSSSPLLSLPLARWLLGLKKNGRLSRILAKHRRLGLLASGLLFSAYPLGLAKLAASPLRWGALTILAGNTVKLSILTLAFKVTVGRGYAYAGIALVLVTVFLAGQVTEQILNGWRSYRYRVKHQAED